jgi:hypothetical protein
MEVGIMDIVFSDLGWQDHLPWLIDRLIYRYYLVLGQVDKIVFPEQPTVDKLSNERYSGCPSEQETPREHLFDQLHKPDRPAQNRILILQENTCRIYPPDPHPHRR